MALTIKDPKILPDQATGLYDVKRLAQLLGVQPSTIRSMKARGTLPTPTSNDINGGAVWSSEIVDALIPKHQSLDFKESIKPELPRVIDLFSGCGGLSLGFRLSGFEVIAGFDNWQCAVETYNANLDHQAFQLDLSDVDQTIASLTPFFKSEIPGIIGGPPCQDFSSAGKRVEGERADLTEKYAQVVAHFLPPFFVMENVARAEKSAAFHRALAIFENAGYSTNYVVLNAARCGVPQRRHRLITVGTLSPKLVTGVHALLLNRQTEKETTVRDWFGTRLNTEFYYRHPRSYARRAIFSIDEPSPTIRGVNRPIPNGYPGHPGDAGSLEEARPLSSQERAEIQTFPPGFQFLGSKTDTEQMIGNAVPVRLAKFVADALSEVIMSDLEEQVSVG